MKILIAHNEYQQAGGEDAVVQNESEMLKSRGHEVSHFSVSNHSIQGLWKKAQVALEVSSSPSARREMRNQLKRHKPDIVHVHNFFPLLTPSIYDACIDEGVPVVQTLHNYRILCANALLLRDGKPCELCVRGTPYRSVAYGCYRSSRAGTLPLARMIAHHRSESTWNRKVNRIIALTSFARDKFIEGGVSPERIVVKPNFIREPMAAPASFAKRGNHALFVGRISEEKGIRVLIKAWRELKIPLKIAGDGPLMPELRDQIRSGRLNHIEILGNISTGSIAEQMSSASFLVMPSLWYEGFPMVLVEAFSQGLPALVSGHGSLSELVTQGQNGEHFRPGDADDLARKARDLGQAPERLVTMGQDARGKFEKRYSESSNYDALISIYESARRSPRNP